MIAKKISNTGQASVCVCVCEIQYNMECSVGGRGVLLQVSVSSKHENVIKQTFLSCVYVCSGVSSNVLIIEP